MMLHEEVPFFGIHLKCFACYLPACYFFRCKGFCRVASLEPCSCDDECEMHVKLQHVKLLDLLPTCDRSGSVQLARIERGNMPTLAYALRINFQEWERRAGMCYHLVNNPQSVMYVYLENGGVISILNVFTRYKDLCLVSFCYFLRCWRRFARSFSPESHKA